MPEIAQTAIKDITVVKTDRYIVLKIPRNGGEQAMKGQTFADMVGVLHNIPELRGKSSVEVQHMIKTLWHGGRKQDARS